MKKVFLFLCMVVLFNHSFAQIGEQPKQEQPHELEENRQTCISKQFICLIDFQGGDDPILNVMCNTLGTVTIERIGLGLYTVSMPTPFPEKYTWTYLQSETSKWREVQIQWQPDGKLYIEAFQNDVHTDIVTQNVSFELRVY
jgi:hypothetical protein